MNLKNYIENIFNNYPFKSKKSKRFTGSVFAKSLKQGIRNIKDVDTILNGDLISKGSPGQSQWSTVPWFAIFDQHITKSAQRGIYIVYLFSADGSKVYLSLNQGWTLFYNKYKPISNAKNKIKEKSSELRGMLSYSNRRFNDIPINLESKKRLPIGYELGNILSIKYNKNNLPNNTILVNDLINMINIFDSLKTNLVFRKGHYKINDDYNHFSNELNRISYKRSIIKDINYKETKPPKIINNNYTDHKKNLTKKDYVKSDKIKTNFGDYGEEIVIKIEKDKLINANRKDLANKIDHVSKTQGDGLGYDIQSFNQYGKKIYIEVKSTTNTNDAPFNISRNELNVSNEKYNKNEIYMIYRLYNLNINSDKNNVCYYTIFGNSKYGSVSNQLKKVSISYSATLKQQNKKE